MAELLRVTALSRSFNEVPVFTDLAFGINRGAKVGLVGTNGAGKSTLLRLIAGHDRPDAGQIEFPQSCTIAYLPQEPRFDPGVRLTDIALDLARASVATVVDGAAGYDGAAPGEGSRPTTAADAAATARARKVLAGLGFSPAQQDAGATALSGGERTRLCLAGLLLARADLLLLDEPTNHLDVAALEWLEEFVRRTPATVLVVSHDRFFLDQVAEEMLELERGALRHYVGNYTAYVIAREAARRRQEREYEEYQVQRAKLRDEIWTQMEWARLAFKKASAKFLEDPKTKAFYRTRAGKRARIGKAKQRALDRLEENPVERPHERRQVNLDFAAPLRGGDEVLRLNGVAMAFGPRTLFRDVSLVVRQGERVALVGPNGSGKTTLLRIALGQLAPTAGQASFGVTARPGYLAQQLEALHPELTLTAEIQAAAPRLNDLQVRTVLGGFLFGAGDVNRPVGTLSTGEKVRLALATLMVGGANCLVLDEPTNHLDLATRERVEEALLDYDGTLLIVSHDRYLLRKLADRVLAIEDSVVRDYPGDYAYYLAKRHGGKPAGDEELLVMENRLAILSARLAEVAAQAGRVGRANTGTLATLTAEQATLEAEFVGLSRAIATARRDGKRGPGQAGTGGC